MLCFEQISWLNDSSTQRVTQKKKKKKKLYCSALLWAHLNVLYISVKIKFHHMFFFHLKILSFKEHICVHTTEFWS